jgi:hypothetical protein
MSVLAKKSITWLWIASLFFATVGVSGQQIYCYCVGETTFSFFASDDSCAEKPYGETKGCCTVVLANAKNDCCELSGNATSAQGCTKKTTKVFQLKTEFTVQEKIAEKLPTFIADPAFSVCAFPFFQNIPFFQNTVVKLFAQPPPALSGRMICVRYGVFRC